MTKGLKIKYLELDSKRQDLVEVLEDWDYWFEIVTPQGSKMTIKKGFVADFTSVPKFIHWLIDPNDKRLREASLGHDYLWKNKHLFIDKFLSEGKDLRRESNREFKEKAITNGYPKILADIMEIVLNYHPEATRVWNGGKIKY